MKRIYNSILLLAVLLSSPFSLAGAADDDPYRIEEVLDLAELGDQARNTQTPILIMFSQEDCSYCVILEEDYLRPMLISGDYNDKVIIRKIRIDSYETLRGFDGEAIEADALANNYQAYVTPTMVFLDHNGRELSKRLMGIGTKGFFAGEIDTAIDISLNRLRAVVLNY